MEQKKKITNVFLSAGHSGASENGASSKWMNEKDETKKFVQMVANKAKPLEGLMVSYVGSNLQERISRANEYCGGKGIAIEVHFNASGRGATGCETVISMNASERSRRVATELAILVSNALGIRCRGVKTSWQTARKKLAFVDSTICPAVILEVCFLDNVRDVEAYYTKLDILAASLGHYINELITGKQRRRGGGRR